MVEKGNLFKKLLPLLIVIIATVIVIINLPKDVPEVIIKDYSENFKVDLVYPKNNIFIKTYDEYVDFLAHNIVRENYETELTNSKIKKEMFDKYDYIARFYSSPICSEEDSYPLAVVFDGSALETVTKQVDGCQTESIYAYVFPVEKDKYQEAPERISVITKYVTEEEFNK